MRMIQVLVATMDQRDFSVGTRMNISCDAVFANQASCNQFAVQTKENRIWSMITTDTRGVGLNRNIALLASDAEIVMFADDDMVYSDEAFDMVCRAFEQLPQADVIIFSLEQTKDGKLYKSKRVPHKKRMRVWNSLKYGAVALAARKKKITGNNITFNQMFGGGCIYGSGEDSLFIKECFDKKLRVYGYDYVIGSCSKDASTWFEGYNEKFFFDKGALLNYLFPTWKYLMMFYFALQFPSLQVNYLKRIWLMSAGIRAGENLVPFEPKEVT